MKTSLNHGKPEIPGEFRECHTWDVERRFLLLQAMCTGNHGGAPYMTADRRHSGLWSPVKGTMECELRCTTVKM